jgi:syntaxin 5
MLITMTPAHSIQDRTPEFLAILRDASHRLKSTPNSQRASLLSAAQKRSASPAAQRSEFARRAAEIGRGITGTMAKLERLTQLARRKTLFDDRPVEINELTFVIKQELTAMDKGIKELQALTPQAKQPKGAQTDANQESEHNKNVVFLLRAKLSTVGTTFKETLETRTRNVQASKSRMENFTAAVGAAAASTPPSGTPGRTDSPLYQLPQNSRSGSTATTTGAALDILSLDPSSSTSALTRHAPQSHQAQLLMMEEAQSNVYIQQRGEQIDMIERTMAELGGLFAQLAEMVSIQGEQIQRIDADTEDTLDNVEGAQRELLKYWNRVSGNRWLVAKMFGVLMIFFLLWVLIAG